MKTNKILVGGVVGGIILMVVTLLVFTMVLKDYMAANYNATLFNKEMIWWSIILSNVAMGLVFSIVFSWTKTSGVIEGAKVGAILGCLFAASMDFQFYAMSSMFNGLGVAIVDILISTVLYSIGGAATAWGMGLIKD